MLPESLFALRAPLTSAARRLTPSILGKHRVQITPPEYETPEPEDLALSGLTSLRDFSRQLFGPQYDPFASGLTSLLGGI